MGLAYFYYHSAWESLSSAQTRDLMMYLILSISLNAYPMSQAGT